jgi:hypothetical protein
MLSVGGVGRAGDAEMVRDPVVNSSANEAPRVGGGTDRRVPEAARPDLAVELTPRGLELLETLNDLFDTLAAAEAGPEPAHGNHGI